MSALLIVLSLGAWPALWLCGAVLLGKLRRGGSAPLARAAAWCLAPALGLALWSLPLVLSAYFGVFYPALWGALGWLVSLALVLGARPRGALGARMARGFGVGLVALMLASTFLYAAFPHDTFFVGRDQATYANQALHLAHAGRLQLAWPAPLSPDLQGAAAAGYHSTGIYPEPDAMVVQFSPVLPLWLAQAYTAFGVQGLLAFNALIAVLCIPIFFALSALFMSRTMALVATSFFALNPAQIWIARVTLSEVLGQYLLLGGLLLACTARRSRAAWLAGSALAGASVFVRIDGFVLAPLALVSTWLAGAGSRASGATAAMEQRASWVPTWSSLRPQRPEAWGMCALLAVLGLGVGLYAFTSAPYFAAQTRHLTPLALAAGLLLVLTAFGLGQPQLAWLLRRRSAWAVLAAALGALGAYAYFVRPVVEPFHVSGSGERTFRENSFVNLGVYITPPLAFIALGGFWQELRRGLLRSRAGGRLLVLVIWAGYSLLYLHSPSISPDHPWGMRRFAPIVIPGAILLACAALDGVFRRYLSRRPRTLVAAVLALGLLGYSGWIARPFLFLREYAGAYALVSELADAVPPGRLVLCGINSRAFGHLALGRGLKAFRVGFRETQSFQAAQKLVREHVPAGETYYLLIGGVGPPRPPLVGEPLRTFDATFRWLQETTSPPASNATQGRFNYFLYEHSGPLEPLAYRDQSSTDGSKLGRPTEELAGNPPGLGVVKLPQVREGGFWNSEPIGGGWSRWTKAEAWLEVPLERSWVPRQVAFDLIGFEHSGWLTVRANGIELHSDLLDKPPLTLNLVLPPLAGAPLLRLELVSSTFKPSELGNSTDQRELGVRLKAITLR